MGFNIETSRIELENQHQIAHHLLCSFLLENNFSKEDARDCAMFALKNANFSLRDVRQSVDHIYLMQSLEVITDAALQSFCDKIREANNNKILLAWVSVAMDMMNFRMNAMIDASNQENQ